MEQFQLDTILNERMRSGLFRYEVMTESLLFDNSDLSKNINLSKI